jgi:dimethylamine/trimethylamine dehydrogenase
VGVLTPDDILRGARPSGEVTIFDDDHYYMAAVIAVLLASAGAKVTYVTPTGRAAAWSHYTGEQERTQSQLLALGVAIHVNCAVEAFDGEAVTLGCIYSERRWQQSASALVLVTSREPQDRLFRELAGEGEEAGPPLRVRRIGDCRQPALIAHAVFAGHQAARELDDPESSAPGRDRSVIQSP